MQYRTLLKLASILSKGSGIINSNEIYSLFYSNFDMSKIQNNPIKSDFKCCGIWNTTEWAKSATWMDEVNATLTKNTDLEIEVRIEL